MNDELAYLREVLEAEAQGILNLKDAIDASTIKALDILADCRGHIIVSGIGKAGLIGQKFSATLASLDAPSFFMHPTEACHGDLGMATSEDVFVLFSNSGTTVEMLNMVPILKGFGYKTVAITAKPSSPLAKHCDATISVGVHTEVCPLGLAPTTSTTVMLAIGDAIALALSKRRGLNAEAYARNHPGGTLGKRLMTCRDVMRPLDRLAVVTPNTPIQDVLMHVTKHRVGSACVVDNDTFLGFFTDGDLRRHMQPGVDLQQITVTDWMTANPTTIAPDALAEEALNILKQKSIDELPVCDGDTLCGLIDIQDLVLIGLL